MNRAFTFTKERWIQFIHSMLIPLLAMVYGVFGLIFHVCINRAFFFTFILFPGMTAALLALCIFSKMRRFLKVVMVAVVLLFFAILYLGGILFGTYIRLHRYENTEVVPLYHSVMEENEWMPSLDEIGQPKRIEYCDVFSKYYFFCADADYLICQYDSEEYA